MTTALKPIRHTFSTQGEGQGVDRLLMTNERPGGKQFPGKLGRGETAPSVETLNV